MAFMSFRPVSGALFAVSLVFYLLVRVWLGSMPGYVADMEVNKTWALGTALGGIPGAYENTSIDYPPVFLYLLYPVGQLYLTLHGELRDAEVLAAPWDELVFRTADGDMYRSKWLMRSDLPGQDLGAGPLPGSAVFSLLIKAPGFLFDIVMATILYVLVAHRGLWGRARQGSGWGRTAAMLYLWNPAVLWCSAYWGQPDAIHSALALGALALLAGGRRFWAGALLATGGLMKPLAAPFVPLRVVVAAAQRGIRGLIASGAGGVAAAILVTLPFFATDRGVAVVVNMVGDLDAMPFTSVNAHNFWWLSGAWENANAPVIANLSAQTLGLGLFVAALVLLVVRNWSWLGGVGIADDEYRSRILFLGAAVAATFFFLTTHMHENHLFAAIPFLVAVAGRSKRYAWLCAAITLVCLTNLVLHDLEAPYAIPLLSAPSPVASLHYGGPVSHLTWGQLIGGYANSVLAGVSIGWLYLVAWHFPSSDPAAGVDAAHAS